MADLTNATEINDMPSGDKYLVGEVEGGWGFRCLEAAAVAFDAITEHPVYATQDEAVAAAMAEDAEQVELRRKTEVKGRFKVYCNTGTHMTGKWVYQPHDYDSSFELWSDAYGTEAEAIEAAYAEMTGPANPPADAEWE